MHGATKPRRDQGGHRKNQRDDQFATVRSKARQRTEDLKTKMMSIEPKEDQEDQEIARVAQYHRQVPAL